MATLARQMKARYVRALRDTGVVALAPIGAIVLIVLLVGVFLSVVANERRDVLREKTLRDTLWVEQTLRFQLSSHEDNIQRLAVDLGDASNQVIDDVFRRAKQIVRNNPEIVRVVLRDPEGHVRLAFPSAGPSVDTRSAVARTLDQARRGNAIWSDIEHEPAGVTASYAAPVAFGDTAALGSLEATVLLDALLSAHVPWWLAERYNVQLLTLGGDPLASKSVGTGRRPAPFDHAMTFSPPFNGVLLSVLPHGDDINLLELALMVTIVGLGTLTIANLWLQHRHARRRNEAERALREEQAFRKAMEDAVTVGLRARDLQGRTLYVNAAYCRMVGWSREEILAHDSPMPWWAPDLVAQTLERHRAQKKEPQPQSFETRFRHRAGHELDVLVYEAPLRDANGVHVGWIGSMIDISDRKRADAQASHQADKLQQTGRLITMGEMASTLAHELNQPLGAIASYAAGCTNMLRSDVLERDALLSALDSLGKQTRRAGDIIRRIHDFVRKREPLREPCDLGEIVYDTALFAQADARRHGVRVDIVRPNAPLVVSVDRVQIEQVVLNLMRNALEAMQGTTTARVITVAVFEQTSRVVVSVSDSGTGISPELVPRIFQPFETTKGNGMGMGLSICRSILESHKGHMWFEAGHGVGASFKFSLPLLALPPGLSGQEDAS